MLNHVASAHFLPLYLYAGQRPIAGQRPLVYLVYIREYYTPYGLCFLTFTIRCFWLLSFNTPHI